jgi:hypothetical protein
MRISTYKIARVTLVFILIFVPLLLYRYLSGSHTDYCPFSHKMSDTSECVILHVTQDRVLVRHSDKYTNEHYFEIIESGASQKYDVPEYTGPKTPMFRIRMVENEKRTVSINGEKYVLLPIDESYN